MIDIVPVNVDFTKLKLPLLPPSDFIVLFDPTKKKLIKTCRKNPDVFVFSYFTNSTKELEDMKELANYDHAVRPCYLGSINKKEWGSVILQHVDHMFSCWYSFEKPV